MGTESYYWQHGKPLRAGDIVPLDGKRWKVMRKGTTAASVRRQFWFDDVFDWIAKKLEKKEQAEP